MDRERNSSAKVSIWLALAILADRGRRAAAFLVAMNIKEERCFEVSSTATQGKKTRATRTASPKRGGRRKTRGRKAKRKGSKAKSDTTRPETAKEVPLELFTEDSETTIDALAIDYVSAIVPDGDTISMPREMAEVTASLSSRSSRGPPPCARRRPAVDEYVVTRRLTGRLSILPPGSRVKRPLTKLVQLVAHAIHVSPRRLLRVNQIYTALQNRYPYYTFLEKKALNSWKSSVRHALFQKWFVKVRPSAPVDGCGRRLSCFWGLNYANKPREWCMPDSPHATPRRHPAQAFTSNQVRRLVDSVLEPAGSVTAGADPTAGTSSSADCQALFWGSSPAMSTSSTSSPSHVQPSLYLPVPSSWRSTEEGVIWAPLRYDEACQFITPTTTTVSWTTPPTRTVGSNTVPQGMLLQSLPPFQQWDWPSVPSDYYSPSTEPESDLWTRVEAEDPVANPVSLTEEPFAPPPPLCSARLLGPPGVDAPGPSGVAYLGAGYPSTSYAVAGCPGYNARNYPKLDYNVACPSDLSLQGSSGVHAEGQGMGYPGMYQDLPLPPVTTQCPFDRAGTCL